MPKDSSELIRKSQLLVVELKELDKQQQQKIGQREVLNKQLQDFGFDNLEEAEAALKELEEEHGQTVEVMQVEVQKADGIVKEAKS